MIRTAFLVDGFNLYHSLIDGHANLVGSPDYTLQTLKWLDIQALCKSMLRDRLGSAHSMEGIYYFSALATHLQATRPDIVTRHRTYIAALKSTGVHVELGRFKRTSDQKCRRCGNTWSKNEEKETDVSIALKVLELFHEKAADAVVLVSGDTDLLPAIRTARRLYPANAVFVAFPLARKNIELQNEAAGHMKFKARKYAAHRLPDAITLPGGISIVCPGSW